MTSSSAEDLFLRGVWAHIPTTDDLSWVDRVSQLEADLDPLGDLGPLVRKMLDLGLSSSEIARFARIIGYEVAFGICYQLDDSNAAYEGSDDGVDEVEWGLFLVRPGTHQPQDRLMMLHERLLTTDPSGNEMRPDQV